MSTCCRLYYTTATVTVPPLSAVVRWQALWFLNRMQRCSLSSVFMGLITIYVKWSFASISTHSWTWTSRKFYASCPLFSKCFDDQDIGGDCSVRENPSSWASAVRSSVLTLVDKAGFCVMTCKDTNQHKRAPSGANRGEYLSVLVAYI